MLIPTISDLGLGQLQEVATEAGGFPGSLGIKLPGRPQVIVGFWDIISRLRRLGCGESFKDSCMTQRGSARQPDFKLVTATPCADPAPCPICPACPEFVRVPARVCPSEGVARPPSSPSTGFLSAPSSKLVVSPARALCAACPPPCNATIIGRAAETEDEKPAALSVDSAPTQDLDYIRKV